MKFKWFIYLSMVGFVCISTQPGNTHPQSQPIVTQIPRVKDLPRRATSVEEWLTQATPAAGIVQVTGVKLNPTQSGLDVILETANGELLQGVTSTQEYSLTVEIPNAQLQLTEGQPFRRENPAPGIAVVEVSQITDDKVRVTVTGVDDLPGGTLVQSQSGLVLSVLLPDPEEEITVTGEVRTRYGVPAATTATKLDLPLLDIPQSIQVIPKEVIEDRQVLRLNELTDNVSGVQRVPGYGGLSSVGTRIRGFTLQFENLRNGFRDFGYQSPRDVANVERVEILKGPASAIYGGGVNAFSGVVNTITKKPLEQPFYQIGMTFGSFSLYRPTVDLTGPLTSDRSLLLTRQVKRVQSEKGN